MRFYDNFLKLYYEKGYFSYLTEDLVKSDNEDFFFQMSLIRFFEKKLLKLFEQNLINGTTHTYMGQEANSAAIFNHIDKNYDIIWSNHRCHGHFISYSGMIIELMAEILGKKEGICSGRGGSQHIHYKNFYSNGLLGGSLPQSVGTAFANKDNNKSITIIFIGDGTLGSGYLYESMNLASIWDCPVLFICENNYIAQTTPSNLTLSGEIGLRPQAFGIKHFSSYDYNVDKINHISKKVIDYVRETRKPSFFEIGSIRLGPHSKGDDTRTNKEIKNNLSKDPLLNLKLKVKNYHEIENICEKIINKTFEIVNDFETAK